MWTRLLGPWGRIVSAVVALVVLSGFSIVALASGHPTSRTVGNLVVAGIGMGGTIVVAGAAAVVLRRRNRLVAEKRGGSVFGVVRLDEHAFKVLADRSGSTASMDDGTFALTSTPDTVEFWKSAETSLPTISLPRTTVEGVSFAPYASHARGWGRTDP